MLDSTTSKFDVNPLIEELTCYLQGDTVDVTLTHMQAVERKYGAHYQAKQSNYQLPLGELRLFELTLYMPLSSRVPDIEAALMAAVKTMLEWHKTLLSQNSSYERDGQDALVFDIQFSDDRQAISKTEGDDQPKGRIKRLTHSFSASYFMEDLIVDMSDRLQKLQVFSWHDWQMILTALQTPCDLWRFLLYHLEQLQQSEHDNVPTFESETALVSQFLQSSSLFETAIEVDNELIKLGVQSEPSAALVAMTLAHKNQSRTAQMYQNHMEQAATLWSQLSNQMIEMHSEKLSRDDKEESKDGSNEVPLDTRLSYWQQQLLDESLFSRHELMRAIYRHPKQGPSLQNEGYVVHQHSYESLGRHYVLIFYGQDSESKNSKKVIQPNLEKIAQDVATRLPIVELHHVIVLGVEFISDNGATFIDLDLWIQPVHTMTQRERQLTKQIQQLKQQNARQQIEQEKKEQAVSKKETASQMTDAGHQSQALPKVSLNLSIPTRKNKS